MNGSDSLNPGVLVPHNLPCGRLGNTQSTFTAYAHTQLRAHGLGATSQPSPDHRLEAKRHRPAYLREFLSCTVPLTLGCRHSCFRPPSRPPLRCHPSGKCRRSHIPLPSSCTHIPSSLPALCSASLAPSPAALIIGTNQPQIRPAHKVTPPLAAKARVQTTRPIYKQFSLQRLSYIFPNSCLIFLSKIHSFHICLAVRVINFQTISKNLI